MTLLAVIVASLAIAQTLPVSIEPHQLDLVLQVGGDPSDEDYAFGRIAGLVAASDGRVYVLDRFDNAVRIFSESGDLLGRFGGSGGGPQEFVRAGAMRVAGNTIEIVDLGANRIASFDFDGRLIENRRLDLPVILGSQAVFEDWILAKTAGTLRASDRVDAVRNAIVAVRRGSKALDTIATGTVSAFQWSESDSGRRHMSPGPFGDAANFAPLDPSSFVVGDGATGTVEVWSVGEVGPRRRARRVLGIDAVEITESEADEVWHRLFDGADARIPTRVRLFPPPVWPSITRIIVDDQRRIWLGLRHAPGRGYAQEWLVLSSDDLNTLSKIRMPDRFQLRFVRGSLLYGITKSEFDEESVQVYRIDPEPK